MSIHAPWEGCDVMLSRKALDNIRFNSRTLGRVRRGSIYAPQSRRGFNSRTLGRVRLDRPYSFVAYACVSIHAPWEGCDVSHQLSLFAFIVFQFTHPGKGATL